MIAPATSTLNVGEVDSLFTRVPRIGFLRTSDLRSSKEFRCRGLGVVARQRPIVSHGGHHLNDGRAGRLRVAPIVLQ
jgi:hypothetical protein